jgi:hypothetical protein
MFYDIDSLCKVAFATFGDKVEKLFFQLGSFLKLFLLPEPILKFLLP